MPHIISHEDKVIIARIAHEAEGIALSSVRELKWSETEEAVQNEVLDRLDRVLNSFDPSVFGKVARMVASTLIEVGLVIAEEPEELPPVAETEEEQIALENAVAVNTPVIDEPSAPGGVMPEFEIAVRGDIKLPDGMTQEEADRLAREADEERELDELTKPVLSDEH